MRSQLEAYGVQVGSVRLLSFDVPAMSIIFEAILSSPSEQQSPALVDFSNYLSGMFPTFAGYPVRDGSRGFMGITSTRKSGIYIPSNLPDWPSARVQTSSAFGT